MLPDCSTYIQALARTRSQLLEAEAELNKRLNYGAEK